MHDRHGYAQGIAEAYMDGAVSIPYALLRTYRALKLSDTEGMLLLQILAYKQLEQNEFPTIEQLQERLGATSSVVGQAVQKLMNNGFLTIDEIFDPVSGIQSEKYNLSGLFQRIGSLLATDGMLSVDVVADEGKASGEGWAHSLNTVPTSQSLFSLFEQEFGRLLTPMEIETINGWVDQDGYAEPLIRFALKESVFAGKLHFRYIDRILLDWSRNRVTNVEEAKLHTQKFRTSRS
ncbi:MAG: DnaD domain-containing protein [Candidatus Cohnella colombiensis]|uniref:DnaD domain-containing protein n=1 Tax=Candidatus Cohnella colombiensis TaxID=3121368 RepID=A0AA95F2P1_9BACL|nr:MAG: DnaD domain-containing protein [Cohnella sp.]